MTAVAPARARLDALFAPRGIAVVGASRDPAKLGAAMARSLRGFPGRVALVNPRDPAMFDSVAAATSVATATSAATVAGEGPIDLAVLCLPAPACAGALAELAPAGVGAAVVCAGGFAEIGPAGAAHQDALASVAAEAGIALLGPNTSGFFVPHHGLCASFVPGAADVPAGRVAVVAASGGVNHALAFLLAEAGHGVSLGVGLGNAAGLTAPPVLDHLAEDPRTHAVALHVESVADGPALLASVSRLAARKPVVALVAGRHTGTAEQLAEFARSHTGALATSWRTTVAALRQAGAVCVASERELVDAVGALSLVRLPAGRPGVGVLTAQAGPGLLLLDELHGRDVVVPALTGETRSAIGELLPPLTFQGNPVDTGRPGPSFGPVLRALSRDPGVGLVAGYALAEPDAFDLVDAVTAAGAEVPVVLGVGGLGPAAAAIRSALITQGIPAAPDPAGVAAAVSALLADAMAPRAGALSTPRRCSQHTESRFPGAPRDGEARDRSREIRDRGREIRDMGCGDQRYDLVEPATFAGGGRDMGWGDARHGNWVGGGPWDEDVAKGVLGGLGVRTPGRRVCDGRESAQRALAELGGAVAVKVLDASVRHKTEVGGVRLGVRTPGELDDALRAIGAPRVLVEAMAPAGVDLLVGARRDPVFGPVLLVGLGGTQAEALADVAVRVAPVGPEEAAGMVGELAGRRLLEGWRGGPVLDRDELGRVVAALGELLMENPGLDEIEVNPLRLTEHGLVALDAVLRSRDDHADR
ncbi:hypothetical protein GCM10023321_30990 [Pseudonocardia eucalypti]|uniref:CoA-binding domain-containing protein n=1 Tax=Pseudonocardia eucalypti TaxID=648755 RepID=A0ABP9Q5C5_9PSEU|nr:acetyltransferase [Pseudonocardia eucalypti]